MSHNIMHIEQRDETRGLIIGAPLLLVAVFCFVLVMAHPPSNSSAKSSSTSDAASTKASAHSTSSSVYELKPLPLAKTASDDLSSTPVSNNSSMGSATASPQSVSSKGSDASTQGAVASQPTSGVSHARATSLRVSSSSPHNGGGVLNTVLDSLIRGY